MNQKNDIDYVRIALWLAGGYVAIRFLLPLIEAAGKARDAIANPIGDALSKLLVDQTPLDVKSGVVFPSGERISMNKLMSAQIYMDENGVFAVKGINYRLVTPRRKDGWFDARRV